jgi:hypothetical protein
MAAAGFISPERRIFAQGRPARFFPVLLEVRLQAVCCLESEQIHPRRLPNYNLRRVRPRRLEPARKREARLVPRFLATSAPFEHARRQQHRCVRRMRHPYPTRQRLAWQKG